MIDEREFWQLIDRSREAANGDVDEQQEQLRALLSRLSREDLVEFARIFEDLLHQSYHWDVWGAGYVLGGGMSDDSFDYFREWLISRGERMFRLALEEPDALAEAAPADEEEFSAEGLWYVAHGLHQQAYGEEMPRFHAGLGAVAGEEWDEDDLPTRYPRLWARTSAT